MDDLLRVFRALADPTRLRILRMLSVKPLCVCEVMSVLGVAQSTTSKHLSILHGAGLVEEVPSGVWTIYRLLKNSKGPLSSEMLKLVLKAEPVKKTMRDEAAAKKVDRNRLCRSSLESRLRKSMR